MTQRERQILRWIEDNPLISQQELAERAGITRSSVGVHISNLMKQGLIAGCGYVLPKAACAAVVGGVNVDIGGRSNAALVPKDSNPGTVRVSLGGVGRNIAHNMALLGVNTRLLTVLGEDAHARRIEDSCTELGIDLRRSVRVPGEATSTYLYVAGPDGDMALAVSDMEIYRHLTPDALAARRQWLAAAQVLVVDTNIPAESIAWLRENAAAPVFADPVSTVKAEKLRPVLGRLHTLKPNRQEAELLSGVPITDEKSLRRAADVLLETGLRRVFLTLGPHGVLAADGHESVRLRSPDSAGGNTTGCGDAFLAALVWAHLEGFDLRQSARAGLAAASIAMAGQETVNPAMRAQELLERINDIKEEE